MIAFEEGEGTLEVLSKEKEKKSHKRAARSADYSPLTPGPPRLEAGPSRMRVVLRWVRVSKCVGSYGRKLAWVLRNTVVPRS